MLNLFKKKEILLKVSVTAFLEEAEGVYYAYTPTMPGLHVEGRTEEEVIQNFRDAVSAYLLSVIKHKDPLPLGAVIEAPPYNARTYSFTEDIPLAYAQ